MTKINILSCTDRPGSNAMRVARQLEPIYRSEGAETQLLTLADFPMKEIAGGRYGDDIPSVDAFNENVLSGDGLVMVVPEYNGGFPGILKVFIDYLPFPEAFQERPIALVGEAAGYFGALRPVEHLQDLLIYRKAHVYPERVFLPRIKSILDKKGAITDENKQQRLEQQAAGFVGFVSEIREKLASS